MGIFSKRWAAAVLCAATACAMALITAAQAAPAPSARTVQDDGREILYNGSRVTHVFVFDEANVSYHPVEGLSDRLQIIYAAASRKTAAGSGQILVHTEQGRNVLEFDPGKDPQLEELCAKARREGPHIMQWMAWMDDRNLVRFLTVTDADSLRQIAGALKTLEVKPAPQVAPEGINPSATMGDYHYNLDFSTGTSYQMLGFSDHIALSTSETGSLSIGYRAADPAQLEAFHALARELGDKQQKASVLPQVSPVLPPRADDIRRIHLYDAGRELYAPLEKGSTAWDDLDSMLYRAKPLAAPLGRPLSGVNAIEVTRESDLGKFTYRLYEHGFTVEGTAVEGETVAAAYTLESEGLWQLFCRIAQGAFDAEPPRIYWLGLMSDSKIGTITVEGDGLAAPIAVDREEAVPLLRGITVKGPGTILDPKKLAPPGPGALTATINFTNGIHYKVTVTPDDFWITSSDMAYGLRYELEGSNCWIADLWACAKNASSGPVDSQIIHNPATGKPVIYLYPERTTDVSVSLDFDGALTYTYPAYNGGWEVTAQPDGTLTNKADGSTHYYLFWEGNANGRWEHARGFVVKGSETEAFLLEKLAFLGLTPREYNDFLTYWVPKMRDNPYNLISFSGAQYDEIARLTVSPKPDSVLRVHMVWQALDSPVEIEPQELTPFERIGFAVVEWGGTEVRY